MRYKNKKRKRKQIRTLTIIILSLIAAIGLYINLINEPEQHTSKQIDNEYYKVYEYIVERVDGSEVFAKATNYSDNEIYFNTDRVLIKGEIETGVRLKIWVSSLNHVNGIERVEVIE
ncbi:hypothetical protein D3C84_773620 [compost metagenome]